MKPISSLFFIKSKTSGVAQILSFTLFFHVLCCQVGTSGKPSLWLVLFIKHLYIYIYIYIPFQTFSFFSLLPICITPLFPRPYMAYLSLLLFLTSGFLPRILHSLPPSASFTLFPSTSQSTTTSAFTSISSHVCECRHHKKLLLNLQ